MKKKLIIGLIISVACAIACNNNAFAVSYEEAEASCVSMTGASYVNNDGVYCSPAMSQMSTCSSAGGTASNITGSSFKCSFGRAQPTTRTGAGKICTGGGFGGWNGTWTASTASCLVSRSSMGTGVSCSNWGAESGSADYGSTQWVQACVWTSLAATTPTPDDPDKPSDDPDDPSVVDPGNSVAPVNDGDCTSILDSSWCNSEDGIAKIVSLIITILTGAVVVAGTIGIILCGFMWMTARDNEAQVAQAKKRMLDIVIGIIAWVLLALIANLFIPKSSDKIEDDLSYINSSKEIKG